MAAVMGIGSSQIKTLSGKELRPIDLHFSYTYPEIKTLLGEYGEEGRKFYAKFEIIADTIYPIFYTLMCCALIGYTWRKYLLANPRLSLLLAIPLLILFFDYAENVCIILLLTNYPDISEGLVSLSSIFTMLKWSSFGLTMMTALVGLIKRYL